MEFPIRQKRVRWSHEWHHERETRVSIPRRWSPLLTKGAQAAIILATLSGALAVFIGGGPFQINSAFHVLVVAGLGGLAYLAVRASFLSPGKLHEQSIRFERVERSYQSLRHVLCSAMDLRDHVTGGHSQRVAGLAITLGKALGLRQEQLQTLELAALLHDIGKLGVPEQVLLKPGPLSTGEWEEMRQHPLYSYRILEGVPHLAQAAEIALSHHERYDGCGYPRGLRCQEIPLEARIFAVVDAYDAMTSGRPYRKAVPHREAAEELLRNAGSQFDPKVVEAFLTLEGSYLGAPAPRQSWASDYPRYALVPTPWEAMSEREY